MMSKGNENFRRKMLAMDARMEGQQVIAANIGEKVEVSQMELIALTTFAEIGLLSVFSNVSGDTGDAAHRDLEKTVDAVRRVFGTDGENGLNRLSATTVAMLRGEKFGQYVCR